MENNANDIELPELLSEIASVAGVDAALAIAKARGGSRVSIPSRVSADHWLSDAVGETTANKICKHFATGLGGRAGAVLDIPLGQAAVKRVLIEQMLNRGISADKIAVEVGVHRTTVFNRKALLFPKTKKTTKGTFK